jgi:hypothetical protein
MSRDLQAPWAAALADLKANRAKTSIALLGLFATTEDGLASLLETRTKLAAVLDSLIDFRAELEGFINDIDRGITMAKIPERPQ